MGAEVVLFLLQDGIATGAIYALLALGMIFVFLVTRILFVPFGDIVSFSALTMAMLQSGNMPGTVWLVLTLVVLAMLMEIWAVALSRDWRVFLVRVAAYVLLPLIACIVVYLSAGRDLPMAVEILLTFLIVTPIAPLIYRIAFEPVPGASVLVLLMISIAVHFGIAGLGLLFFGSEGYRTEAITDASFTMGSLVLSGQSIAIVVGSLVFSAALYILFQHTLTGKALRATAINRTGARLMGIQPSTIGGITFTLASCLGVASGILIGPTTTLYYDSGFLIGLKAFVGAVIGGLVSYPGAVIGGFLIGILETASAFLASAFKEVIVFGVLIPILLWRSLSTEHFEEDDHEEEEKEGI